MDYAKQYQEYLARANQALEKACETFLPEESEVCRAARYACMAAANAPQQCWFWLCAYASTAR